MTPRAHGSLYVLFAASVFVLETTALQLANDPEVINDQEPKHRLLVVGSEAGTAHYNKMERTGVTSILKLLKGGLKDFDAGTISFPAAMGAGTKAKNDFYIGSIRNPCDYYVSLWASNADNPNGQLRKELSNEKEGDRFFKVSESKTSEEDIKLFRDFVKHIQGETGVYTGRLASSYIPDLDLKNYTMRQVSHEKAQEVQDKLKEFTLSQIDCWVSTETLAEDMQDCMKMLAFQRDWPVDWTSYNETAKTVSANPSKHGKCKDYYDSQTEWVVQHKDHIIFDKFLFNGCCDVPSSLSAHLNM